MKHTPTPSSKGEKKCNLKGCDRKGKIKTTLGYFCTNAHRLQVADNIALFLLTNE